MTKLTSKEQLRDLLTEQGVDLESWGKGSIKSIDSLWREIQKGESVLGGTPLCRTINVVQIIIRQNKLILFEAKQKMANGNTRNRNWLPAEKMHPDESVHAAAVRGIEEELGVTAEQITIQELPEQTSSDEQYSPSYPGLLTRYNFFTVEAVVEGLPAEDFTSQENSPTDPVRVHYWNWLPEQDVMALLAYR